MRRLIVILALLLLVVACRPGEKKAVTIETPFVGGTQGLLMEYQDFRTEVFDGGGDPFEVIIKLENKGETLVPKDNVRIQLSGINPAEFNKAEADLVKPAGCSFDGVVNVFMSMGASAPEVLGNTSDTQSASHKN